ncbi:NUDIX domain-containing protein [Aquimarina sp. ERC-38]|uniref:NUDIX hydrolase n=1 Tax=Aquimarina sp. ERC-38 TaxID=2949996 RepID=UPI002245D3C6|nr:NUDIX domain-containing protein [Aquimarina sp. ERC-38]UZO79869.1 NUDIX domain-containing protein [Aquimarina sp. ERC-38]
MADEFINILDEHGKLTGEIKLKSEAHRLGLYHSSVHIWFYTKNGELLIQKRADFKDTFPNLWDVSVAGHISVGETPEYSAIREISEEIGLTIKKDHINFIGVYLEQTNPRENIMDNEFHYIYLAELQTSLEELVIQEEEVAAIKMISLNKLKQDLSNPDKAKCYVPHEKKYFDFVFSEIQKLLSSS